MEQRLFGICNELKLSYITISHRPALVEFHDQMITIGGEGQAGFAHKQLKRNRVASRAGPGERLRDLPAEVSIKRHMEQRSEPYMHLSLLEKTERAEPPGTLARAGRLLRLAAPKSTAKFLVLIITGVLAKTGLHVLQMHFIGRMLALLIPQDVRGLFRVTIFSLLLSFVQSAAHELMRYYQRQLMMGMRDSLTKNLLSRFYRNNNFYAMLNGDAASRLSDPEQRLADDVDTFTEVTSETLTEVVSPIVDCSFFSVYLFRYVGVWGVAALWGYLLGSLAIYQVILPDYKYFIEEEKALQGKFKFVHGRVRTHAESVAFFGGGEREREIIDERFDKLMVLLKRKRVKDTQFGFGEGLLREKLPEALEWGVQFLFLLRSNSDGGSQVQYDLWGVGQAVTTSIHSFTEMLKFAEKFSTLSGLIARIAEVDEALNTFDAAHDSTAAGDVALAEQGDESPAVEVTAVDLVTPKGTCLASKISCEITPDRPLMVTGPNACGKTSFFRTLAGLWPLRTGTVSVRGARRDAPPIFLVPQRIYCCVGSLADQVTYPQIVQEAERTAEVEERILSLLDAVGIEYLAEREGGLSATTAWDDVLSLGEQQRLGMARMFYSRPVFGVLDECTSACSVDVVRFNSILIRH